MVTQQPVVLQTVAQFAQEIIQQGLHLRQAILFGSYARGEQSPDSDIDVALVADEFVGVSFEDIKRFIDVTIQQPYFKFELHTFNTTDFNEGNSFVQEIRRTGISVL